jgi:hypothetical protein
MNWKDGEKDAIMKDKVISLYLKPQEEESTDKCFVDLEITAFYRINSVTQARPALVRRENEYETLRMLYSRIHFNRRFNIFKDFYNPGRWVEVDRDGMCSLLSAR